MQKLLFAINHKQTEEAIEAKVSEQYLVVGAVTYREAVLDKLESLGADTLLIRETLQGTIPIEQLLNRVRVQYPHVRVIIICQERPKRDPFLKAMVDLGIYDIINLDRVSVDMITSYILTPRTFRDVAQYGLGIADLPAPTPVPKDTPKPTQEHDEQKKKQKKGDLRKGLLEIFKPTKQQSSAVQVTGSAPEPVPEIPQVNMDLIHESMREAEMRKAQANLDTLIQEAVQKQTTELTGKIEALEKTVSEKDTLLAATNQDLMKSIAQLDEMRAERDKLKLSYTQLSESTKEGYALYEEQINDLRSEINTPAWYKEQADEWAKKEESLNKTVEEKNAELAAKQSELDKVSSELSASQSRERELEEKIKQGPQVRIVQDEASKKREEALTAQVQELKAALEVAEAHDPDLSAPEVLVPMLPDNIPYEKNASPIHISLLLGAKHGVGTSTVGLNLATALATQGNTVLLVEFNNRFPMLNQFFELTHIPYGIEEAFAAISNADSTKLWNSMIQLRGISTKQRNLAQAYRKLPVGFNLMLFSNNSLANHDLNTRLLYNEATINSFLHFLIMQKKYTHIIFDVQCDDFALIDSLISSSAAISDLSIVMTQDPHAIASAGQLMTYITKSSAPDLLVGCTVFISRFNKNVSISQSKIEKMLHLSSDQIITLSEDSSGYLDASYNAVPYVLGGRFKIEYTQALSKKYGKN